MFEALRSRWAMFGALAIALYVGAEVSIGSIMINFLNQRQVLDLPFEAAGGYLANFYWGGALCGRIVGTPLLTRMRADRLLAGCGDHRRALVPDRACRPTARCIGYAALAIGFFNSIMFPTIFSITLERSGVSQSATSGLLCARDPRRRAAAAGGRRDRRRFGLERLFRGPAGRLMRLSRCLRLPRVKAAARRR